MLNEQNKQKEINFFNKFYEKEYDVFTKQGYNKLLKEFKRLINPLPGEIAVDFGCGTGAFTRRLKKYGIKLKAIDISQGMIEFAQKQDSTIDFIVGDIEDTKIKNESVDIVIFSGVLHHFPDFSETIKEAYRILKKGGRLFAYDPNKRNPAMWLYRDKNSPLQSSVGRTDNERLLTAEEITNVLKKIGFYKILIHSISGVEFSYLENENASFFLPLYNFLDSIFSKTPLAKKYGSFLITKAIKN